MARSEAYPRQLACTRSASESARSASGSHTSTARPRVRRSRPLRRGARRLATAWVCAILERLTQGEARVTDLAEPFALSLNAISKHIRMLERAGLVRREVRGHEHILSVNPEPLEDVERWITQPRALWKHRLRTLDALLQAEERARKPKPKGRR